MAEHFCGVPVSFETDGREEITLDVLKRVLTNEGGGRLAHYLGLFKKNWTFVQKSAKL
jgi:hypothetical protein